MGVMIMVIIYVQLCRRLLTSPCIRKDRNDCFPPFSDLEKVEIREKVLHLEAMSRVKRS